MGVVSNEEEEMMQMRDAAQVLTVHIERCISASNSSLFGTHVQHQRLCMACNV